MKKKRISMMALLAVLAISLPSMAQKSGTFKGIIVYDVTYPGISPESSQMDNLPKTVTMTTNGDIVKFDVPMPSMSQSMIINPESKTTTILMEMMGNKVMLKPKKGETPSGKEPQVKVIPETKEIAGYQCKKAEISFGDEKSNSEPIVVYFSDELGNNKLFFDNEYRTLPGIPLEFTYKLQGRQMHMIARTIEKTRISSKDLAVPPGYQEMTPDQLRQMFGGN
ncbi:MAG: hypothetical protein PHX54_02905 [Lentimicrobiaceae bacterium]|nr:hypothetical protein [Lentimicrobiaceae bacterium]